MRQETGRREVVQLARRVSKGRCLAVGHKRPAERMWEFTVQRVDGKEAKGGSGYRECRNSALEWTKGVGTHVGEGIAHVRPASKMRGVGGDQRRRTEVVATCKC